MRRVRSVSGLCGLLWLLGCEAEGEDEDEGELVAEVPTSECQSGLKWVGGDEESERMHPGRDCIGCHETMDEGPSFAIAGTVYGAIAEPDDCFGVPGIEVEVTDAAGQVFTMFSNDAGNFWLERESVTFPISAKVADGDRELAMVAMQTTGACATCHTPTGANDAPGRILAP